eukprot:821054-Pelagomonas_calceolata.AAC.5
MWDGRAHPWYPWGVHRPEKNTSRCTVASLAEALHLAPNICKARPTCLLVQRKDAESCFQTPRHLCALKHTHCSAAGLQDSLATLTQVDAASLGLNVVGDGLQEPLSWRSVQHAQDGGVGLGGKELEDGQHAARTDVFAVQETQSIRCKATKRRKEENT